MADYEINKAAIEEFWPDVFFYKENSYIFKLCLLLLMIVIILSQITQDWSKLLKFVVYNALFLIKISNPQKSLKLFIFVF